MRKDSKTTEKNHHNLICVRHSYAGGFWRQFKYQGNNLHAIIPLILASTVPGVVLNSGSPERGARSPERPSVVAESRTRGQGAEVERRFRTPRRSYPTAGERVWCVILGALPFLAGVLAFEYLFGAGPRVIIPTVLIVGAVVLLLVLLTNGLLERKGQWAPSGRKAGIADPVISL